MELVLPTVTVPKFKVLAEKVTGALPLPVRVTIWGLLRASSLNVSVPVAAPAAAGENVTPTVQPAPPAMLVPQVLLDTAKPALVAMPEKLSETFWRFLRVTVLAALVFPTATVPKLKEPEDSVTGALPLPASVTICFPAS